MVARSGFAVFAVVAGLGGSALGGVFADFESGNTSGFGTLSSSGVVPFVSPVTGTVLTPSSGSMGTQVFSFEASGYNGGLAQGTYSADLGYDFVANGNAAEFLANDVLEFDWSAPPGSTAGYSQIYQIVLNAQGAGYTAIDGYGAPFNNENLNQFSFAGYNGVTHHYSFNYAAYKANIAANPGWIQLGLVTNNGGGAPTNFYFDNFTLSTIPEPTSLATLALASLGLLGRRHRHD